MKWRDTVWFVLPTFFWVGVLSGCAWFQGDPEDPVSRACPPQGLAGLEARFVTEASVACKAEGAHSISECKAYPEIRDRYRAERGRWVECQP